MSVNPLLKRCQIIVSSPYTRALQTAATISKNTGLDIKVDSYAMQHPGKVEKYIGVGQMVSMESEIFSYRDALEKAKKKGDDTKAMEAAGQAFIQDKTMPNMINLRMQVNKYHKIPKCANQIWLGLADMRHSWITRKHFATS